jgi:hypothetical protein
MSEAEKDEQYKDYIQSLKGYIKDAPEEEFYEEESDGSEDHLVPI